MINPNNSSNSKKTTEKDQELSKKSFNVTKTQQCCIEMESRVNNEVKNPFLLEIIVYGVHCLGSEGLMFWG